MFYFVRALGVGFFGWLVFGLGWIFKAVAHLKIWTHFSGMTRTLKASTSCSHLY